jgi:hypothetical protein
MPGPSEELFVDLDVSGDDIPEGLTFAFQDDDFVVEGESLPPSQDDESSTFGLWARLGSQASSGCGNDG